MGETDGNSGKRRKQAPPAAGQDLTDSAANHSGAPNAEVWAEEWQPPVPSLYELDVAWICHKCRTEHCKANMTHCRLRSCKAKRPPLPGQETEAQKAYREKHMYQPKLNVISQTATKITNRYTALERKDLDDKDGAETPTVDLTEKK